VKEIWVREGDAVKTGQVLARIDPTEYQRRWAQAQETALAAKSQMEIAQRQWDTNKALVDQGFISQTALQNSTATLNGAKATHMAAVAALELGSRDLHDYLGMVRVWEPEKTAALAAGFQLMPEEQKRKMSELCLAEGMGIGFPVQGEVLAYLVAHPPEKPISTNSYVPNEGTGSSQAAKLTTDYVVELGKEDPEKAGGWIEGLPDGEAKWYAARNLQSVWSLYDPAAAERWVKSLPAATREKVMALK
jgi:pyruvate/2-oxoglutarate dehydrogenase complex dihydrolipoamide acyltransferase (E2) component